MIDLPTQVPTILIPAGSIVISWLNLKLIAAGCFISGFICKTIILYIKQNNILSKL